MSNSTFIPTVSPGTQVPSLLPRQIDPQAVARGVTVETPPLQPGQKYWRANEIKWVDEAASQGRHHIFGNVVKDGANVAGVPLKVSWPSGATSIKSEDKSRDLPPWNYWYNYPMSPSLNEFAIQVGDGTPSEVVKGIGMGADGNSHLHTSTIVDWELATASQAQEPAPSEPPATEQPQEPTTPAQPTGDNWTRSINFVHRWEGGYQNNPNDRGNWTGGAVGKGENKGTKYGISAASYPQLDIPNLTLAEADAIYQRDYWQASNAAGLPWPYCLLAFDTAVLHGVTASKNWQAEVGNSPFAFAAKRLHTYTQDEEWHYFGVGWVNRVADLLVEASK